MMSANAFLIGLGCVAVLVALVGSGFAFGSGQPISFELYLCGGAGVGVLLLGYLNDGASTKASKDAK